MPSSSKKQHNFMEAIAHNKAFAKKAGVSQSVGKDFATADKGKTFKKGGEMATKKMNPRVMAMLMAQQQAQEQAQQPRQMPAPQMAPQAPMKKGGMTKMAKGGMTESKKEERMEDKKDTAQDKKLIKKAFGMHDKQEHKGDKGTNLEKLKRGGETMGPRTMKEDVEKGSNKLTKFGQSAIQKRGMTRGTNLGDSGPTEKIMGGAMKKGGDVKKYAKGGFVESSMKSVKTNTKAPHGDGIAERGKTRAMMPKMKGRVI